MSVSLTWHGHAALSLEVDGTRLLVDPFFTDNPAAKVKADEVTADYILITHGHDDHVGDALDIGRRCGAMLISNFEICHWFEAQGHDRTHAQHIGGGFEHPFGRVKLTIAYHGSSMPDGSYGGNPSGFLLTVGGKQLYISGDTAVYSDMQLLSPGLDLAVIAIGDNFTMGPDDAILAVKYLRPRVVIPYHYDTWPPITVNVERWAQRVREETDSQPIVLAVEGSYTL